MALLSSNNSLLLNRWANARLDRDYMSTATSFLAKIKRQARSGSGILQQAIFALQEHDAILRTTEQVWTVDDPVLARFVKTFEKFMNGVSKEVLDVLTTLEQSGKEIGVALVLASILVGQEDFLLQPEDFTVDNLSNLIDELGLDITVPTDDLLYETSYADNWASNRSNWVAGYTDHLNTSISAQLSKETSVDFVDWLGAFVTGIPFYALENTTRTLHAVAYRDALLVTETQNQIWLAFKIRIAQLDTSTCLACIGLHGTPMAIGDPLVDHFRGRCSCYYVIAGVNTEPETMRVETSSGTFEDVPFQTGEEWFASLPEDRQREQAAFKNSPGKYNAYTSGIRLSQFVTHSHDLIFGDMIFENSLVGMFGSQAYQFYQRNQKE